MTTIILITTMICAVLSLVGTVVLIRKKDKGSVGELTDSIQRQNVLLQLLQETLSKELHTNREETLRRTSEGRMELNATLKDLNKEIRDALADLTKTSQDNSEKLSERLDGKLTGLIEKGSESAKENRRELSESLKTFSEANTRQLQDVWKQIDAQLARFSEDSRTASKQASEAQAKSLLAFQDVFDRGVQSFNNLQREKFGKLEESQAHLIDNTEKKLEQMRETVDEKLQKTLNERLGQSFETVGKQLIEVQKGLGEMQNLAQDVGGLKKVLSNVKMRGGLGEMQLSMLLEQILAPEQYAQNVKTKLGSSDLVEYAIKLPGQVEGQEQLWLPVDAKFPKEYFGQLQNAYDSGATDKIELAQKNLESAVRKMAKDIHDKYIDPPATTPFAIMFLPFEGLFAEIVRKPALLEEIQRESKVVVTGPTTLAAVLNSLQIGFKTLAIQKRSSEVWQVLGAVKKEFENFGGILAKAQNNIQTGMNQLDDVMGRRTRAIQRRLSSVEALGDAETKVLLPELVEVEVESED